jgi:hypothetical protein
MWHTSPVTPDQARAKLRKLASEREHLAESEASAIVEALNAGVKQTEIALAIGRSREHIRRVARAHDVPLTREPTVVSRRSVEGQ